MGKVIGTCGCLISEEWEARGLSVIDIPSYTEGAPAVLTMTVCEDCYNWYNDRNQILKTEQDKKKWLNQ